MPAFELGARAICQAVLDPQFRVQHRGETAAEERVDQFHVHTVWIGARDPDISDAVNGLGGVRLVHEQEAPAPRGHRRFQPALRRLARLPASEPGLQQSSQLVRLEVAGTAMMVLPGV